VSATDPGVDRDERSAEPVTPAVDRLLVAVVAVAVVAGTVVRFWPRSDLWLDEALSVNIARLPIGDIGEALRRDGHPPLYYLLLHVWTGLGGTGDWWVRALSGLISLVGYPLSYLAGTRVARRQGTEGLGTRRLGLITLAVYAVLPFGVRYAAETRMYSLMMVLVLCGYLLVDDLLSGRRRRGGVLLGGLGVALVTAALLWSHYWALWLAAAVGLLALWRLWRDRDPDRRKGALATVVGLAVGGLLFVPWVPSLLEQSAHTGTPWGKAFRPATMLVVTVVDFAGGSFSESQLGSYLLVVLIALATFGALAAGVVTVRGRVDRRIRTELVVVGLTLGIAWAVSYATSNTFASRYTAVVFPLFVLCVAAGVAVARSARATALLLALVVVAGVFSSTVEVLRDRTQAGAATDAVAAGVAADPTRPAVVITCPDQLAPAVDRALAGRMKDPPEVIPFPTGGDPRYVDWRDYGARNRAADPAAFVQKVRDRIPAEATVYVAVNTSYLTFEGKCDALLGALGATRDGKAVVVGNADNYYEAMSLWVFAPRS
jgi:mannosyltransferase